MKNLDALLVEWVGESDESRAEGAFRAYYSIAFPSLVRHVQLRTGWDLASSEDVAQEAVLRFFERVGRGRREAAARIRLAAIQLTAPHNADPYSTRIAHWAREVGAAVDCAVGFRPSSDAHWRTAADALSAQILSLQRMGWRLMDEARAALQGKPDEREASRTDALTRLPAGTEGTESADVNEGAIAEFARKFTQARPLKGAHGLAAQKRRAELGSLLESVLTIVESLPRLRVPSNGYLFEIATSVFLDEIKRRRRKKRGGGAGHAVDAYTRQTRGPHPLEALPDEFPAPADEGIGLEGCPACETPVLGAADSTFAATDPMVRYEHEEFFVRFYEYLRSPVARAVRAFQTARSTRRALAEQCRLECVSRKFSRMMTVLSMMGEGYTQEETARRAGLSRNQVKYILESVKEAYARFTSDGSGASRPRVNREGESHVS